MTTHLIVILCILVATLVVILIPWTIGLNRWF